MFLVCAFFSAVHTLHLSTNYKRPPNPPDTVPYVDISKYVGVWY